MLIDFYKHVFTVQIAIFIEGQIKMFKSDEKCMRWNLEQVMAEKITTVIRYYFL